MRPALVAAGLLLTALAVVPSVQAASVQAPAAALPLGPCSGDFDVYCYDEHTVHCGPGPVCTDEYHWCLVYYTVSARHFCVDGAILS